MLDSDKTIDISDFYDNYSRRQMWAGVNERHRSIIGFLMKKGLKPGHRLLEVGCGIGTLTGLLAGYIGSKGKLTAVDISPKSIELAKNRLKSYKNIDFIAADFSTLEINDQFDVIVFPDVLEHIPKELHDDIFKKAYNLLKDNGLVLIHIPDPEYLDWMRKKQPGSLQIVDQSLYLDHFHKLSLSNSFYISYLKSYSIWARPVEYQVIIFRKIAFIKKISNMEENLGIFRRIFEKFILIIHGKKI